MNRMDRVRQRRNSRQERKLRRAIHHLLIRPWHRAMDRLEKDFYAGSEDILGPMVPWSSGWWARDGSELPGWARPPGGATDGT